MPASLPPGVSEPLTTEQTQWFVHEIYAHDSSLKSYLHHSFPSARLHVDDVVQESYLRIWKARAAQPIQVTKAFLFKVARNLTLDLLRHNSASPITIAEDLTALPVMEERTGTAETVCLNEKIRLLAEGLATLPPRGQEVLVLRKLKGLSRKEVSLKLSISEKTVDEHLSRGLKRLCKYLRNRGVLEYYER